MTDIIPFQDVKKITDDLHKQQKSIIVAGGCFDLLHIGHITFLEEAKKQGDVLVVILESDASIKKSKGIDRPIHTQLERAHLLSALKAVDIVVLLPDAMTNQDYDNLLLTIKPKAIATTVGDPHVSHKERQAHLVGAKIIFVNTYIPTVSTTILLNVLKKEI